MVVEQSAKSLTPVTGAARIDVLDILRGVAILGIFYINVPYMAASVSHFSGDIRSIGWSAADRDAWAAITVFLAGSQRCLLQFLFGAGMMIATAKAMRPDGPVAVADLYYRRNLWLLAFGLFDVFFLLWPGDILHIYALAALFLFPFRRAPAKWLLALGLGWAVLTSVGIPENGVREYIARTALAEQIDAAESHRNLHIPPSVVDRHAIGEWRHLTHPTSDLERSDQFAQERAAHAGGFLPYAREAWSSWKEHVDTWLLWDVIEAFCTMLIGVVLWKWGIIQGQRTTRFYCTLLVAAYGFGIGVRAIGIAETFSFQPGPRLLWMLGEYARLAMGLGHLAVINLLVRSRVGVTLLAPFRQAGRIAFSLYFLQQLVGMYILFAPFGLNLWGRFGWAEMAVISTIGIAVQLLVANIWLRFFVSGPLEWIWRSLAYNRRQPFSAETATSASALKGTARPVDVD